MCWSEPSNLFQRLDTHFLDHGLPDLVRHPGRRALGLVRLHSLACEYVQLLRASLAKFDVRVAPGWPSSWPPGGALSQ